MEALNPHKEPETVITFAPDKDASGNFKQQQSEISELIKDLAPIIAAAFFYTFLKR